MSSRDRMDGDNPAECFDIASTRAYVASACAVCRRCHRPIEVICLYCQEGRVDDERVGAFRVQCLWAVDEALGRQLSGWSSYRWSRLAGRYLNHCAHCAAEQDEDALHEEPGAAFYELAHAVPAGITLQALTGRVRMGGDCVMDL